MGRFKFSVKDLFSKILLLTDYPTLSVDAKELVDYTIKESLKCNSVLRVRGFRTKYLKPKKANLWFISWSERIELGMALEQNDIFEILKIIYGINEKQFVRLQTILKTGVINFNIKTLKSIE